MIRRTQPGVVASAAAPAASRFVALLRGINVGRAGRLPMADLAALLRELGWSEVRTQLNSGNAVFGAVGEPAPEAMATRLHEAVRERLGLDVPVQVRPAAVLRAIVDDNPLAAMADNPSRLLVAFPAHGHRSSEFATWLPLLGPAERIHVGADAAYFWLPEGILASRAAEALLGRRGANATTRNWATVRKIVAAL